MNKVVCNLCGTTYPDNAAQCPICGYARSAESSSSSSAGGSYTYVKGGRFSKANVKKRNKAAGAAKEAVPSKQSKSSPKSGAGLTVVVIILLLAIVAVLGYVALRFFVPNSFLFEGLEGLKGPSSSLQEETNTTPPETEEIVETEPDLSCTSVTVTNAQLQFFLAGAEAKLAVTVAPANTPDLLTFSSSNFEVATVSEDGVVTAVGNGSAVITITCGEASAECLVICEIPEPEEETVVEEGIALVLNRKEITFNAEGESWILYDGEIPVTDIVWSSDDSTVAAIENGKVVAIGNGSTTVYAAYNNETVSCLIHCQFDEDNANQSNGITEADNDSKMTYKLYNPTGYADDVTLNVGEKFTLRLVDEYKNIVTDAEWTIEDANICSYEDSIVKALKSGTTKVIATYEGKTYTCLVRVN